MRKFILFLLIDIVLGFLSLPLAAAKVASPIEPLIKKLVEMKAAPGEPFPAKCWDGFRELDPSELAPKSKNNMPLPPRDLIGSLVCISISGDHPIKQVTVLRAGKLISSLALTFAKLPGKRCSRVQIQKFSGNRKVSFATDLKDPDGSQITGIIKYAPEVTLSLTCSKIDDIVDAFTGKLQTKYSLLGTIGTQPHGNIVFLGKTTSFRAPPYFNGSGDTAEEMLRDTESLIKQAWPRAKDFGPLARKLLNEDVTWARNRDRIAKVLEYKAKIREARVKSSVNPESDAKKEMAFFISSPCHQQCASGGLREPGPKCAAWIALLMKMAQTKTQDPSAKSKDETDALAPIQKLMASPESIACENEKKQKSQHCVGKCPQAFQEAAYAEVNKLLKRLKEFEDEEMRRTGTFSTDLSRGMKNLFDQVYAYKIGFVKPTEETTPETRRKTIDYQRMNTDYFLEQGYSSLPTSTGARNTPFAVMAKFCPDCTANRNTFKAVAFADPKGDGTLDVWTIDQTGNIAHIANGFPNTPASPPVSAKVASARALPANLIQEAEQGGLLRYSENIGRIPDEVKKLRKLFSLELTVSSGGIPEWIGDLDSLRELGLRIIYVSIGDAKAVLSEIPESIGRLKNLERLNLSFRAYGEPEPIRRELVLPTSLSQLTKLAKLSVLVDKKLRVAEVTDSIYSPPNLVQLTLQVNKITPAIKGLKSATKISFHAAGIESLPAELGELPQLIELDLQENALKFFPYKKGTYQNIASLSIEDNHLTDFPVAMIDETPLRRLFIGSVCFPQSTLKRIEEAKAKKHGFTVQIRDRGANCNSQKSTSIK